MLAGVPEEFLAYVSPRFEVLHSGGNRTALRAEKIQVGNYPNHRFEYVDPIVDEVRDAEFAAVNGFLRAFQAEAYISPFDAGPLEKLMVLEPLHRLVLNSLSAL